MGTWILKNLYFCNFPFKNFWKKKKERKYFLQMKNTLIRTSAVLFVEIKRGRPWLAQGGCGRFPKEVAFENHGRSVEAHQLDKEDEALGWKSTPHFEDTADTWCYWKPSLGLSYPICQMSHFSISHGAGSRKPGNSVQKKKLKFGLWTQPTQVQVQLYYLAVRVWARQSPWTPFALSVKLVTKAYWKTFIRAWRVHML